jgi:hypothetical protein
VSWTIEDAATVQSGAETRTRPCLRGFEGASNPGPSLFEGRSLPKSAMSHGALLTGRMGPWPSLLKAGWCFDAGFLGPFPFVTAGWKPRPRPAGSCCPTVAGRLLLAFRLSRLADSPQRLRPLLVQPGPDRTPAFFASTFHAGSVCFADPGKLPVGGSRKSTSLVVPGPFFLDGHRPGQLLPLFVSVYCIGIASFSKIHDDCPSRVLERGFRNRVRLSSRPASQRSANGYAVAVPCVCTPYLLRWKSAVLQALQWTR